VLAAVLLASGLASAQSTDEGLKAYQAGDHARAREILQPLAEAGNAVAMRVIGVMLDRGEGGPENPAAAVDWLTRSEKQGDAIAAYYKLVMMARGRGMKKDPNLALQILLYLPEAEKAAAAPAVQDILTDLLPAPLEGWETEELTWKFQKQLDVFVAQTWGLSVSRMYWRKGDTEKLRIQLEVNPLLMKPAFQAYYEPLPDDEKRAAALRELKTELDKVGFRRTTYRFINGLAYPTGIALALDRDTFVNLEILGKRPGEGPPEEVRAYLEKTDLRGARAALQGLGLRKIGGSR
jgi:TPR repeat protein